MCLTGCGAAVPLASDLDRDGISDEGDRCPGDKEDGADPDPSDGCAKTAEVKP